MRSLEQLETRLKQLQRRVVAFASFKGISVIALTALLLTVALVSIGNRLRFASGIVVPFRILLFAGIAAATTFALVLPLLRTNRRRLARLAESKVPELDGRLLTVTERPDSTNPFTELIAADTLQQLRSPNVAKLAPASFLYASLFAACVACAILVWMIAAGPGYWGYGSLLLWTGTAHAAKRPLYDIAVQPGDRIVRRESAQLIAAQLVGFTDRNVTLYAKYRASLKWDALPMSLRSGSDSYQLLFSGLGDSLDYYVRAGGIESKHYTIAVKDLPVVKRLRVEIEYPSGLGLSNAVQDPGGDIRAVEDSEARVSVLTDKPLANGSLVLEDGFKIPLSGGQGPWMTASLPIKKDGSYHVAELDGAETVRISDDYFIEAKKDEPPSVRIVRPGADPQVSPIEEVPVAVEASDDFGIRNVQFHYSVNGGPEQVKTLVQGKNTKDASAKTTLYLEDFKLQPGDLVSFYASAQDASHTSRTDMMFAQAEPFDFKFRQSQQAGGGGMDGGAGEQRQISERQKEIIAATWNEIKTGKQDSAVAVENARFLSGLENKLGDQAKALAARMGSRDLTTVSPEFDQFSKEMTQASAQMSSAVDQLKPGKWNDALPPEQKALQSLLRAESIFREIQVAYGQRGGGGGSSGGQQRELARLYDLELDNSKNQYETGQSANQPGADQQKKLDEALERLKELAQRQQGLAQQQRTPDQQFQQRWEEEQLRREAEQLRQQMEQMAQNSQLSQQSQSGQRSGQQSQSGQQSGQQSQSSQSGRRSQSAMASNGGAQVQAIRQALDSLQRAENEMRDAVSRGDRSAQTRAAEQLAQAQDAVSKMLHQQTGAGISDLAEEARQLAERQKQVAEQVKSLYGAAGINTAGDPSQPGGASAMPEMDGPDYAGGWWRNRMRASEGHPPTANEKRLADSTDQLASQMQQLQQQLQKQAQSMADAQPGPTRQLRKALSEAEQKDLALRMQKNAQWLRDGYGSSAWPMEDSITAGVQQLSKQLDEVQGALNKGSQGPPTPDGTLQQALSDVRLLRQQLQQSQAGSRPLAGNPGSADADGRPTISESGSGTEDALNQLYSLRSEFGRSDRQFDNTLDNAIGSLRRIRSQAGRLDAVMSQDAVTNLARLELELTRRLNASQSGAHTGTPENTPEQYRDALAKYYRQLSN